MNTEFIKRRMKQVKKTNEDVAAEVGISAKHYSQIINDNANPTLNVLKKIAKALNTSIENLFVKTIW